MAFKLFTALTLCVSALAAPMTTVDRRWGANTLVISARGSYQPPGAGSLQALADFLSKYARGVATSAVNYPAVLDNYGASVSAGITDLQGQIASAVNANPDVNIILLGYSQGAQVVLDSLCGSNPLPGQYSKNIKAVTVFGDPSHQPGQSFVKPSMYVGRGMVGRDNNPQCDPYSSRILSYCNSGDPVCAGGQDGTQHESYFSWFGTSAGWQTLNKLWSN